MFLEFIAPFYKARNRKEQEKTVYKLIFETNTLGELNNSWRVRPFLKLFISHELYNIL